MRHCEAMLIQGETELLQHRLIADTSVSLFVAKVSHLLRMVVRLLGGEDPVLDSSLPPSPIEDTRDRRESRGYIESVDEGLDWVLQREAELVRLERENEELKRLVAVANQSTENMRANTDIGSQQRSNPSHSSHKYEEQPDSIPEIEAEMQDLDTVDPSGSQSTESYS